MLKVEFHNTTDIDDDLLKFAVIAAKYKDKWIFCRHKERDTYEIPGGHREAGEIILDTARRELQEETGALEFDIMPVCIYSVMSENNTTYGMLFTANVKKLGDLSKEMEIGEIILTDTLPDKLTYPAIQPYLFEKASSAFNMASP